MSGNTATSLKKAVNKSLHVETKLKVSAPEMSNVKLQQAKLEEGSDVK